MTTKADFSEEEWKGLLMAPMLAGMYIIVSDVSVTAMAKELAGMMKGMSTAEVGEPARDIVAAIVADYTAKAQNKEKPAEPQLDKSAGDPKKQLMDLLLGVTAVFDAKEMSEEKAAFNQWLLSVANATAEAGKEGGFLGIGAVRVSDKERAALAELRTALG